jgi:hypothetical protein
VFILLAIIVALAIGNNIALAHLQSELRLVERRQLSRHESRVSTNTPGSSQLRSASRPTPTPTAAPAP